MIINRIGQWIIFLFMSGLGLIAALLPISIRGPIGIMLGRLMKLFGKARADIAYINLSNAFPEKSKREINDIIDKSFDNLGITFIETAALAFLKSSDIKKIIDLKNYELIIEAAQNGRGVIMLSGHYGNWEYLALAAGLYSKIPITVVVKKQKNKFVNDSVNKGRTKFGNKIVLMTNAAKSLIQAIRSNEAVALLVDQSAKYGKDGVIDFFNMPAVTFDAPAELALRFRTPIVYAFAERNADFSYTAELCQLDFSDLEYSKENVKILTMRHVAILEEQIRKRPELWAWQHRRWKHYLTY